MFFLKPLNRAHIVLQQQRTLLMLEATKSQVAHLQFYIHVPLTQGGQLNIFLKNIISFSVAFFMPLCGS